MICPNCKKENKYSNIKCEYCHTQLIDVNKFIPKTKKALIQEPIQINISKEQSGCLINGLFLLFVMPWLLTGIMLIGLGLFIYNIEKQETKGYKTTIATIKEFTACNYEDTCYAVYEYEVEGIVYQIIPDFTMTSNLFNKQETIHYNPKNPTESIIYTNVSAFIIAGSIIVTCVVIAFIIKSKIVKKIKKKHEQNINKK